MGVLVPPRPPTHKELAARRAAGATTFEELDPEFCKYLDRGNIQLLVGCVCLIVSVAAVVFTVIIYYIRQAN